MGLVNDLPVSEHFRLREFEDSVTRQVMLDPDLVEKLEAFRALCGGPVVITSGYRTPATNAAVGGAQDSQHEAGRAADIVWPNFDPDQGAAWARQVGFSGIGRYRNHLHVDVRPGPMVEWKEETP